MARVARIVVPGFPHHVTQRGVRSMRIFRTDEDRREYLYLLSEHGRRSGLTFLGYCLMANHVHLIAVPERAESLARGIGEAHRRYTRAVNHQEGVKGYLFQGRFSSCPLDEPHLGRSMKLTTGCMVGLAWDYRWSSAAFHVGLRVSDPLVDASDRFGWTKAWREQLQDDPVEMDTLRKHVRTGRPCGDDRFLREVEHVTGRNLHPQRRGRPRKDKK